MEEKGDKKEKQKKEKQEDNNKEALIERVKNFLNNKENTGKQDVRKEKKDIEKCTGCTLSAYQQRQVVPREVLLCYCCGYYKEKIHYCSRTKSYLNIDYQNLCFFESCVNPEEVEGTNERGIRG